MTTPLENIIREVYRAAERVFPKVRSKLLELSSEVDKLSCEFANPIERNELKYLVVTVDSGFIKLKYANFAIAVVVAHAISSVGKGQIVNVAAEPVMIKTLKRSEYALHYISKIIEYKCLYNVLEKVLKEKTNEDIVVLLDGALTYPEESTDDIELMKLYREYCREYEKILAMLEKYRDRTYVVAIAKDLPVDKYLDALEELTEYRGMERYRSLHTWLCKATELLHERTAVDILLRARGVPSYLHPVRVDNLRKYRAPAIPQISRYGVYGTYVKLTHLRRPLYVEFIGWSLPKVNLLMTILYETSNYSPRPGYPAPLFIVDRLTKVDKAIARAIATAIEYAAKHALGELYVQVFTPTLREEYEHY